MIKFTGSEIHKTLALVWPLLLGMFLIMVGNGLQGTLLSLRAKAEGFPVSIIGMMMSLYYCGYVAGWYYVPRMISTVGHIRVFAAFASLASTTILLQGMFVDPFTWSWVRILSGISFVGLFIVSESWLNNISSNRLRGQILSAYFFVINGGFFAGQFLLNLAPIEDISLFVLISVIISLSLMPITLANKPSPGYEEPEHLPFKKVFKIAPLSVMCMILTGFAGAAIIAMGPIYAQDLGYPAKKIAWFIALYCLGCGSFPLITGKLSDNWDRRKMIVILSIFGVITSAAAYFFSYYLLLHAFLIGGAVSSVHSIAVAMMHDRLKSSQITSATASLILINALSACFAPVALGLIFDTIGQDAFFPLITVLFVFVALYGSYRNVTGPDIDVEQQSSFSPLPTRAISGVVMTQAKPRRNLFEMFSSQAQKILKPKHAYKEKTDFVLPTDTDDDQP